MRICNVNVDLEDLSSKELFQIEREIREIRKRRGEAELLHLGMTNLIKEAQEAGFSYEDYGIALSPEDIEVRDLR